MNFDGVPLVDERVRRRVIIRLERRPALRAATPIEPAPLGAQDVNECVPDGPIATGNRLRELLVRELRNHLEEFLVCPVVVVVETFEILNSHTVLQASMPPEGSY